MTRAGNPDIVVPEAGGADDGSAGGDGSTEVGLAGDLAWLRAELEGWGDDGVVPGRGTERSPRVEAVARVLGLSPFERDTLLLAAAVEMDGEIARLVAEITGTGAPRPTFGMALQLFADAHWDALAPAGPLRRWRLVSLVGDGTVATRRLRVDEDVLHHLAGLPLALTGVGDVLDRPVAVEIAPGQHRHVEDVVAAVTATGGDTLVRVDGPDHVAATGVAMRVAARLVAPPGQDPDGVHTALLVAAAAVSRPGPGLEELAVLVDRACALSGRVPVLVLSPDDRLDPVAAAGVRRLAGTLVHPVVVTVGTPLQSLLGRVTVTAEVSHPPPTERRRLWRDAIGRTGTAADEEVDAVADELAHHHLLAAHEISGIVDRWAATPEPSVTYDGSRTKPARPAQRLRRVARVATTVDLDDLAQRLRTDVEWDDLVLPDGHVAVLEDLVRRVRHRALVHHDWGFGDARHGDVGTSALFAGDSGTGKTLAARAVAHALDLDLYRVDLSTTVDKYIGETEKNLSRIFDAAETGGVVLLFDEADALFGRRGEVRDGRDRYANLEVAHLLQRMESYRGLAVLTTNLRSNVDRAFLRRLTFVLNFPFPGVPERAEIWRRAFPADAPLDGVDPDRLARMALTGGSIASMALSAAFAAAEDGTPITTAHVRRAARIDAAKHDRLLTDRDLAVLS